MTGPGSHSLCNLHLFNVCQWKDSLGLLLFLLLTNDISQLTITSHWLTGVICRPGARSSSHRCPTFCFGFRVERHVSWKRCLTVCNGVWDTFSLVWWVCQKCQQQHVYKPRGIKETARSMGSSEVIYKCLLQLRIATIEDIRRHVCHESFIQYSISTWWWWWFVSKCN